MSASRKRKRTVDGWPGYILKDSKGRDVFYVRRQINGGEGGTGKRYDVSTRCHSLRAALKQLERFEADPENYTPEGPKKREPLRITEKLVQEHLEYCRDVKQNTGHWLNNKKAYLAWWAERLGNLDLRRLSLAEHIKPALSGTAGRAHKIAVLKFFFAWLRKEKHLVALAEDPTVDMLPVPQAKPAQLKKSKVIPAEHYETARKHLVGHWRNALDVQAATGWHTTELVRFAEGGAIEPPPTGAGPDVAGVLVCPWHKIGDANRTPVSAEVFEAGKRLREHGHLPYERYCEAVKAACKAAGIEPFTPGRFRHTVATHAINSGAPMAAVATYLNHRSPQTTRRAYATLATPGKIPTLR